MNKTARMMLLDSTGGMPRKGEHKRYERERYEGEHDRHRRSEKPHRKGYEEYDDDDWEEEGRLDEHTAHEWMEGLHNEDGSTGPHWTMEQVKQVLTQKNLKLDPLQAWVALNMMYSDYYTVAKKLNVNNVDFYLYMAQAFLEDKDATDNKLYAYYKHIVK